MGNPAGQWEFDDKRAGGLFEDMTAATLDVDKLHQTVNSWETQFEKLFQILI